MGLSLLNPEFPSPAGRFLLLTTKVGNRTLLSKKNPVFFLRRCKLRALSVFVINKTLKTKKKVLSVLHVLFIKEQNTQYIQNKNLSPIVQVVFNKEIRVNPLHPCSLNKRKQKKEAAASFNYHALAIS
jgi:hypothetical protein